MVAWILPTRWSLCSDGLIDAKVVSPLLPLPTVVRPIVRREDLLPAFITKVCSTATTHVKTSLHSFDTNLAARTYLAIVLNPYEDGLVVHFSIGVQLDPRKLLFAFFLGDISCRQVP